jgi:Trk K+ transport system NAD-binding subunit
MKEYFIILFHPSAILNSGSFLGVAVVGIEQDPNTRTLQIARSCGIPVLIADGASRAAMEAVAVSRAVALVAASSENATTLRSQ